MKKILITTLICMFVLGFSASARAVIIDPGDTVSAVAEALPATLSLLETIDPTWAHGEITGDLLQLVYRDTSDGNIIFYYEVGNDPNVDENDPHDSIRAITATNYKGFSTYVAYVSTSVAPGEFDRSASGATVGFDFSDDRIAPGEDSVGLWVKTDTPYYRPGEVSIIDGGSVNVPCYGPAVPEPTSMLLLGIGLIGLAGGRIRKRFKA